MSFPNPEEPGALDLALAEAARLGADLVLASDPDGDRLAVAVPDPAAGHGWRTLTGDQVGSLLGAFLLGVTAGDPDPQRRLVASTVVSSEMLAGIAAAASVRYAETLTGFKWIVRAGEQQPGSRFVFGYEEALGYAVGDVVRDKDGISAALALLSLASRARAAGQSLLDRWDALEVAHGVHLRAQLTVATRVPGEIMTGLRAAPPAEPGRAAGAGRHRPGRRRPAAAVGCADLPAAWAAGWWCGPAAPSRNSSATWRSSSRSRRRPGRRPPPGRGPDGPAPRRGLALLAAEPGSWSGQCASRPRLSTAHGATRLARPWRGGALRGKLGRMGNEGESTSLRGTPRAG